MKIIYLDSDTYNEPADIHNYLQEKLDFPDYYGKNLAALFDCMTDISEETVIRYHRGEFRNEKQELYFTKVLSVLKDAAEENVLLILEEI